MPVDRCQRLKLKLAQIIMCSTIKACEFTWDFNFIQFHSFDKSASVRTTA